MNELKSRELALMQERRQAVATYYEYLDGTFRRCVRARKLWHVVRLIDRKLWRVRWQMARLDAEGGAA